MREVILVVDMLRGFLEEEGTLFCGHPARQIIPHVVALLKQKKEATPIFVCDTHKPDDAEFRMFPAHCVEGTKESEVVPELADFKEIRISKTRYSAFIGTSLERTLKDIAPEKVIVVGVCTHICILYSVFELQSRDYMVEVPRNCVASFDEAAHEFALKQMGKVLGAHVV